MNKYGDFEIAGIYRRSIKFLLVISVLLLCLLHNNVSYALGFVLGGSVCLLNFRFMVISLEGMINRTTYSKAFFSGNYLLRLILTTSVLAAAILLQSVNLFTTVIGILTIKIIITIEAMIKHISSFRNPE